MARSARDDAPRYDTQALARHEGERLTSVDAW